MTPLRTGSLHTEADCPEQDEQTNDSRIQNTVDGPVDLLAKWSRDPINAEAGNQDGKPKSGIVVMDVGDTAHSDEGNVVKEPTNDGVDGGVVDVVNVVRFEVAVATLPADCVPCNYEGKDSQAGRATPVDNGVTEEEILDNCNYC